MLRLMFALIISCFTCLSITECKKSSAIPKTLFTKIDSEISGVRFINKIENTPKMNILKYPGFYNGGGVALGDINNDGLTDVFFTSNQGGNALYLNRGNFVFENITKSAKIDYYTGAWSTGAIMADINGDGFLDIYICNSYGGNNSNIRRNRLFINNKDNTFLEKTDQYQLGGIGFTSRAIFFDYDLDGDLDLLSVNNSLLPHTQKHTAEERRQSEYQWNVPRILKGGGDRLYRNDGQVFKDVTLNSNIYNSLIGYGTGLAVGDINGDRYPDIYISNDFYERDYLYINNTDGTFSEQLQSHFTHTNKNPSNVNMADINNDGITDIFVTGHMPSSDSQLKKQLIFEDADSILKENIQGFHKQYVQNILQLGHADGTFSEIAYAAKIGATSNSKSSLILDMDNDGLKDIYISTGVQKEFNLDFSNLYSETIIQRVALAGSKGDIKKLVDKINSPPRSNFAFKNNDGFTFSDKTKDWGLQSPSYSGAIACADLDNDGDLDLISNNTNEEAFIYRNNSERLLQNNYIKLKLIGEKRNVFGIGSLIKVFCKKNTLTYEHFPSNGHQSSMGLMPTIGLGKQSIDSIQIIWPDKSMQSITNVGPNQILKVYQKEANKTYVPKKKQPNTLLKQIANIFLKKPEQPFNDYKHDSFTYRKLSKEGPSVSIGDVNGDDLEDVFFGGSKNQKAELYLQLPNTNWQLVSNPIFEADKKFEDTCSAFADVDKDGDLDLIVGSGGNYSTNPEDYKLRLYINNGKGTFSQGEELPQLSYNTSVIAPFDFDNDGDMDFFVGARSIPLTYGLSPKHGLMENKGNGNFIDVKNTKAPALKNVGMVTDALWTDINGDGISDLVLSCDWGSPFILKNLGGTLKTMTTNLSKYSGFWQTIATADLNEDGKNDIILGNQGHNALYQPTKEKPIKMLIKDIDKNGTIERILYQNIEGKDKPIATKSDLEKIPHFSFLKNMSYSSYANKSLEELFPEVLRGTIIKEVYESQSMIALNQGDGNFVMTPLPEQIQWSTVNTILVLDVNKDGHKDLIIGGNNYDYKTQFGYFDQSKGNLLLGNGKGAFKAMSREISGLKLNGKVVDLSTFKNNHQEIIILATVNNQAPITLKTKK